MRRQSRAAFVCLSVAALMWTTAGCGTDAPPEKDQDAGAADVADVASSVDTAPAVPECPFAQDGTCDEPASCVFGSDEVDCAAACAQTPPPAEVWGACQFRARGWPDLQAVDPDLAKRGSGGSGGRYGWTYGTIEARNPLGAGQVTRYYLVWVPDSYDPARPAPIVYYLGGFGVSMYGVSAWSDLNRTAERNGFIAVYAEQHMRDMGAPINRWMMGWHVYLQAFAGDWADNPDVDFLVKLTDRLKTHFNVDRTRVYVTGHSRGGGMSVIAPFIRPDVFAGLCGQAAFSEVNQFNKIIAAWTGRRFPAVLVHGTLDDNVKPIEFHETVKAFKQGGWKTLEEAGAQGETLRPYFVPGVGHTWQPNLNQEWIDFLFAHPIPLSEVAP